MRLYFNGVLPSVLSVMLYGLCLFFVYFCRTKKAITMNKVKRLLCICTVGLLLVQNLYAQTRAEKEIRENPRLAAGKYMAYEAPDLPVTPSPEGYVPCYISTYARHGSRYLTGKDKYEPALVVLGEAERQNGLTADGKRTLAVLRQMAQAAENRYGELTPKGARQHRELVRRMFHNYPDIFVDGAHVDARSTYKPRAFLSMAAACVELKGLNPRLNVTTEASRHDAYYLKYKNPVYSDSCQRNADSVFAEAKQRFVHPERIMKQLFTSDYLPKVKNPVKLACDLFEYHGISQSSDNMPDLAFLFTIDELYDFWQLNNFEWYYEQGPSPLSGGQMPNLARNLLRNFVEAADTALASMQPCATLRFGHDTNLAPLVALMQIDGFDYATAVWDSIPEYYQTYRMIPMCGNVQLVFFRKPGSDDILVKPLLNEREVHLTGVPTECFPFYHWSDLRRIWLRRINAICLPELSEGMDTD